MAIEAAPYDVPGPVTVKLGGPGRPPGTLAYHRVYGARAMDIRPGDLVACGWRDDETGAHHLREFEVTELVPWNDRRDMVRVQFRTTTGALASVGMLQPMAIARLGTHATLADSV